MKILVCVKQVIAPDGPLRIDDSGEYIDTQAGTVFRMNRFDEFALEEALRMRESFAGVSIDAVSVGPARAARTLRRALEMGADEGIHLVLKDDTCKTPWEIASLIGAFAQDRHYDLILAGVMAEDDMQAQVGPMLAEMLGYPWATAVMSISWPPGEGEIRVERELEGGRREAFMLRLPALLTIQSGINRPRYPALSHVLRARCQELMSLPVSAKHDDFPYIAVTAKERIVNIQAPVLLKKGEILTGTTTDKALRFLQILRERGML